VEWVHGHADCREDSSVAGEETVLKPYCYAHLVVDETAIGVGVEPGEWRG
jgi:hypothetical protein